MLLTAIFVFIGVLLSAAPQTDWQKDGLHGKVKNITGDFETTTYNPQGYLESFTTEIEGYTTIYTYDAKGRFISLVTTDSKGEFSWGTSNTYDASGLLATQVQKDTFGSGIGKYEYNAKKQLMWIKTYSAYDDLLRADEYLYDASGNNIRINYYGETMELWAYTTFAYDKKNKLLEKREYELPATEQPVAVDKYDAGGLLTESSKYHKGALDTRMTVSYDNYGNVTENKVYFAKKDQTNFTTFIYTYDTKGNWLTKEELRDGKLNYKQEREITYY